MGDEEGVMTSRDAPEPCITGWSCDTAPTLSALSAVLRPVRWRASTAVWLANRNRLASELLTFDLNHDIISSYLIRTPQRRWLIA